MISKDGSIIKQAFGRHGFLGSLYDIRCDRFEGGNLFNQILPSSMILTSDCANSSYIVDENISQKDTFNKLNVEASLKLSLMAGLIKVEGSAEYLNQTKTDSRTVRVTFMLNVKTKQEYLQISMAGLSEYFSADALENPNATHCVIGITWGARVAATFEQILSSSEAAEELQGRLAVTLKKIAFQVNGDAALEHIQNENSKFESLKISFFGDILIEDVPRTIEDVFNIFKQVPSLLKELNHGKGQQLEFEFYPLKRMAEIFKHQLRIRRMIQEVTNSIVNRIENIFEQIIQGKRIMNDYLLTIEPWKNFIPSEWTEKIYVKQQQLAGIELETQRRLALLLEQIRRGEANESQMVNLLEKFEEDNPCSLMSIKNFLKSNSFLMAKIECLSEFDQHVLDETDVKTPKTPNLSILFINLKSIDAFVQKYYNNHIYLLHISNEWEEKDRINWYKQLRCFKYLYKSEQITETKTGIFRVIDHDLHQDLDYKPNTSVIYYAHHGTIKTKDYYHTSLTQLSLQQIRNIQAENKFLTLTNIDIERFHKEFIETHPNGELNENELANEFQKLYPGGDSRHFCNLVFPIIDKDRNGFINFVEFMSALSLTLPSEMEQKVSLIFDICSQNKEEINREGLIQYLEAMIQLECRISSTDTNKIKSITNDIIKFHKRQNNQVITKEEFIVCLKANYEWCMTFLPPLTKSSSLRKYYQDHENVTKTMCKFGLACHYIKIPSHCREYSHPGDENIHRMTCGWGSDCNDQSKQHLANFSHSHIEKQHDHQRKTCMHGVNCLIQFTKDGSEHNSKYSHPCRFAELCRNPEAHLTHEPLNVSQCSYDKNCNKLDNPVHRSKYRHTDLPYFLIPCRDQADCKDKSKDHRIRYSHGEKVCEPKVTAQGDNYHQQKTCQWGAKCTDDSKDHQARFSHPSN